MHFRIDFKTRLGLALDYISELLTPYAPECSLISSSRGLLVISVQVQFMNSSGESNSEETVFVLVILNDCFTTVSILLFIV